MHILCERRVDACKETWSQQRLKSADATLAEEEYKDFELRLVSSLFPIVLNQSSFLLSFFLAWFSSGIWTCETWYATFYNFIRFHSELAGIERTDICPPEPLDRLSAFLPVRPVELRRLQVFLSLAAATTSCGYEREVLLAAAHSGTEQLQSFSSNLQGKHQQRAFQTRTHIDRKHIHIYVYMICIYIYIHIQYNV